MDENTEMILIAVLSVFCLIFGIVAIAFCYQHIVKPWRKSNRGDESIKNPIQLSTFGPPGGQIYHASGVNEIVIFDVGGSSSRVFRSLDNGSILRAESGAANPNKVGPENTAAVLAKLINEVGLTAGHVNMLVVGMAGVSSSSSRDALNLALKQSQLIVDSSLLISDAELAHIAAFGYYEIMGEDGIDLNGMVCIAGTGSIVVTRGHDFSIARSGGLGIDKGDEGCGEYLGIQMKRLMQSDESLMAEVLQILNVQSQKDLDRLNPNILTTTIDTLISKYPTISALAVDAGKYLASLCNDVHTKARGACSREVKCYGSILKRCRAVREQFSQALREYNLVDAGNVQDALVDSLSRFKDMQYEMQYSYEANTAHSMQERYSHWRESQSVRADQQVATMHPERSI